MKKLLCILGYAFPLLFVLLLHEFWPGFAENGMNIVFNESYNYHLLVFVLGVFVCELVILFMLKKYSYMYLKYIPAIALLLAVTIGGNMLIFSSENSIYTQIAPKESESLLSLFSQYIEEGDFETDKEGAKTLFCTYYFRNKEVVVPEEMQVNRKQFFDWEISLDKISYDNYEYNLPYNSVNEALQYVYSYQHDNVYFIIDSTWQECKKIELFCWDEGIIFCSDIFGRDLLTQSFWNDLLKDADDINNPFQYLYENRNGQTFYRQIIILLSFVVIGLITMHALLGGKFKLLAVCLAFPVGSALICLLCTALIAFNLPFSQGAIVLSVIFYLMFIGFVIWRRRIHVEINYVVKSILCWSFIIAFFVWVKMYFISGDSIYKVVFGMQASNLKYVQTFLGQYAPYGLLEPAIHGISNLFGVEMLFAFYPCIALSGIGVAVSLSNYLSDTQSKPIIMPCTLLGIVFLLTNYDYVFLTFWMLSNGAMGTYLIIIFGLIIFEVEKECNLNPIIGLCTFVLVVTRVEGACIVIMIYAIMVCVPQFKEKIHRLNYFVASMVIIWNLVQMVIGGVSADSMFWTPQRGGLLIAGSLGLIVWTTIMKQNNKLVSFIEKKYVSMVVLALLSIIILTTFVLRDIARIDIPVFLSHFATSDKSNSAGVWCFILFLIPVLFVCWLQEDRCIFANILGYLLLTLAICLFRRGQVIHTQSGDSARRMLIQIVPLAIWSLTFVLGKRLAEMLRKSS